MHALGASVASYVVAVVVVGGGVSLVLVGLRGLFLLLMSGAAVAIGRYDRTKYSQKRFERHLQRLRDSIEETRH